MKIAIVHDKLVCRGGAEQVALSLHAAFPDAPIYTLSYDEAHTYPQYKNCVVKTSWFGKFIKKEENVKKYYFPMGILAMLQLDMTEYDVIVQSTTHCAKYIRTKPGTLIITYCHNPFRLAWSPESYQKVSQGNLLMRSIYQAVIGTLRKVDKAFAAKTTWFITNSTEVVKRIESAYQPQREITVINPAVNCSKFQVGKEVGDYYLVVSRLEPYKRVDLVIETFNRMPDRKLIIVGSGTMETELRGIAGRNITFLKGLTAIELAEVYAECKALIFPQLEDYGITPLEANASGRPVIAYGKGGVLETMVPYSGNANKATAVFFNEQTIPALMSAIQRFENLTFDPLFIRSHAETFDEPVFVEKIKSFVLEKYHESIAQHQPVALSV